MKFSNKVLLFRQVFTKIIISVTLLTFSFLQYSCSDDKDDLGKYYEGTFNDNILFVSALDSTNIVLEQAEIPSRIKKVVPYSVSDNFNSSDSIKVKLYVSFGSNKQIPTIIKETSHVGDSVYIWYSTRNKYYNTLSKSNNIVGINTSPKPEYVSIDSVVIYKAKNKFIKLFSRIIN